jgi:hypothetical protein
MAETRLRGSENAAESTSKRESAEIFGWGLVSAARATLPAAHQFREVR